MPIAEALMRESTISRRCEGSHSARAPIQDWLDETTSMSALSTAMPSICTSSRGARRMTRGKAESVPGYAGRDQSRGEPGQRALDHAREDVVGPSREWEQRYVAATFGHDPVRAIAAEGNDRGRAKIAETLRGFGRVASMAHDCHREWR